LSKPWSRNKKPKRADVERQLRHLEDTTGLKLECFKKGCTEKGVGMDECLTCEQLVAAGKRTKAFRVVSCAQHRLDGLAAVKKHALVKHPVNLLRVIAAGLKGEKI
jgi:hypothetical protein